MAIFIKNQNVKKLVIKCLKILSEHVNDNKKFFTCFDIPNTSNEAFLSIIWDELTKNSDNPKKRFVVSVCRQNTDMVAEHIHQAKNSDELLAYLTNIDDSTLNDILKSISELSDKIDDKWL